MKLPNEAALFYISIALTWKKGEREPPACRSSRWASIFALIIFPASAVSIISPFFGAWPLNSEKRSRDPSWQVMVISHVAISATWGGGARASRRLCSVTKPLNFFHRVDGPADQFHGRSYLLVRRQPLPSQHSLLQRGPVRQSAGPVVQCRRPAGIDIDFVIVAL
jgi:hypothetical protein